MDERIGRLIEALRMTLLSAQATGSEYMTVRTEELAAAIAELDRRAASD